MVPVALQMLSFHSLCKGNWKEVQLVNVMPLVQVSVSHDVYNIINGTMASLCQNDSNEGQHNIFGHVLPLTLT